MGRHLNVDRWFFPRANGTLQRKRVNNKMARHFPKELRKAYQQCGATGLTRHLQKINNCSIAEAWQQVKRLFNEQLDD